MNLNTKILSCNSDEIDQNTSKVCKDTSHIGRIQTEDLNTCDNNETSNPATNTNSPSPACVKIVEANKVFEDDVTILNNFLYENEDFCNHPVIPLNSINNSAEQDSQISLIDIISNTEENRQQIEGAENSNIEGPVSELDENIEGWMVRLFFNLWLLFYFLKTSEIYMIILRLSIKFSENIKKISILSKNFQINSRNQKNVVDLIFFLNISGEICQNKTQRRSSGNPLRNL